jgi:hypothetical protein
MEFHEQLPDECPPSQAEDIIEQRDVFRLVASNPPTESDFKSHKAQKPHINYTDECRARALSVCSTQASAERTSKLPNMIKKGAVICCRVKLLSGSGKILQTGTDLEHYSWWRSADFNPIENCEVVI